MNMKELLLEHLKDLYEHPFDDFDFHDVEKIELEDFLYWLGRKISK